MMTAVSSGKAVASLLVTATIFGIGFVVRRYRRNHRSNVNSLVDIEDPLIVPMTELTGDEIREFVSRRGRVELHCHLNGTVRESTLRTLLNEGGEDLKVFTIEDAFREFGRVYRAITTESSLRRIVCECLEDALLDNIRYIEIRTTPRKLSDVHSRRDYVSIVVDEITKFKNLNRSRPLTIYPKGTLAVRLILTVDRAQPVSVAEQTIDIALRFSNIVVGIDFAGNPTIGSFAEFVHVFERARGHGLFTTVHTSEIRGVEGETDSILAFKPNRVGHFLFPTESQLSKLIAIGIHIETCPTSNRCALAGDGHSVLDALIRHPNNVLSINTDDRDVFDVTLTDEIVGVANNYALSRNEIDRLITAAAHHAFLTPSEREALAADLMK